MGFTIFGIAATLILNLGDSLPSWVPRARWSDGTWANLTLAYVSGPGRGDGRVPAELLLLRAARRRQAFDAPVGRARGEMPGGHRGRAGGGLADLCRRIAGDDRLLGPGGDGCDSTIMLGLALPFIAGLWGVKTLFLGFRISPTRCRPFARQSDARFLRRLTVAWAACYTAVTPVMIFWLWTRLSG